MTAVTPRILGTGYSVPSTIRTNDDPIFDWLKKNNPAGTKLFTGYDKRHILAKDQTLIDIIKPAALFAMDQAGVTADQIDLLLCMTVVPGFGGQAFMPEVLPKIETAAKWRDEADLSFHIEVDGGIDAKTASRCSAAGANVLVAGSSTFKAPDMSTAIKAIREA